jgi:membrane-associated HD superfamily phosphohydrolase
MDMNQVHWPAILAATVAAFVIGGLWYSPALFGKMWMRSNRFTDQDLAKGNQGKIFGIAFVFTLIMAINLAMFLANAKTNASWGATAGFLAGFGWVALGIGIVALFERRPWSYIFINGGYMTVALVVMGLIIGAWR